MSKEPVIEFCDFSFRYDAQVDDTLKNINLKIYENEKILILGSSGSGKSTLSYCMNGLIPHSFEGEIKGSCKVRGVETRERSIFQLSHQVGTVLQDSDLQFVGLNVGEDIAFALENQNMSKQNMVKQVAKVADRVGMGAFLNHLPFNLSGGQKQKVALAGVMLEGVNILLFDEPLASLDPDMGKKAIELIDQIKETQKSTVIIIEHRLEDVLYRKVDRIVVMDQGTIVSVGTPDEILASNVLLKYGMREPLYLSAIKQVSKSSLPAHHLDQLDDLPLASFVDDFKKVEEYQRPEVMNLEAPVILEFSHVDFSYRDLAVLKDISFKLKAGERVSILGENGAGKSTLAKLISGAIVPKSGTIYLNQEDALKYTIRQRAEKVGWVMQNPNQMLVRDVVLSEVRIALELRNVHETEIVERVDSALKLTGLFELRQWPIASLSYGQKKRVTIASILVLRPQCIILDEPTAGQDYRHYREIMEFTKQLSEVHKISLLFITHDLHLAMEYTDRSIVLSEGKIIADAPATEILSNTEILKQASLKETSLSQLSQRLNIKARNLIEYFVDHENEVVNHG